MISLGIFNGKEIEPLSYFLDSLVRVFDCTDVGHSKCNEPKN